MHFPVHVGGFEGEFHLIALHRAGQVGLAQQAVVSAGKLFPILLENE